MKLILIMLLLFSCDYDDNKPIIDVNKKLSNSVKHNADKKIKVAVSAMTSPKETYIYYEELLDYLSKKTNTKFELIQRRTYKEVNDLIVNGNLDFAFICSGAYVDLTKSIETEIVAVPQINGHSHYQAYIITNTNKTNINNFADFKGRTFAFTDPLSNTGKLYAINKLKEFGTNENDFFSKFIYSYAHDNSINLVNKNLIDGATVDGLIYDYLKNKNPENVKNIKIIEKSEYFGIPPIVAKHSKMQKISKIREILLKMHEDPKGKKILKQLNIERFTIAFDSAYNSIRNIKEQIVK